MRDGIADGRTRVLVDAVLVEHDEKWRLSTYRCACGRLWVEEFWSVGHMDIYYVFPVPDGVDAKEWLSNGNPLAHASEGPLGKP